MAFMVHLKSVSHLRVRSDRIAKVTFRGRMTCWSWFGSGLERLWFREKVGRAHSGTKTRKINKVVFLKKILF